MFKNKHIEKINPKAIKYFLYDLFLMKMFFDI